MSPNPSLPDLSHPSFFSGATDEVEDEKLPRLKFKLHSLQWP